MHAGDGVVTTMHRARRRNGHSPAEAQSGRGRARRVLGRYRLTARLAAGGTAEVWRAVDERTNHPVAVKLLHPHLLPDDSSRARLAAEARAVSSLDHPGILRVLEADAGEQPAVVLELVKGESLNDQLARSQALDPRQAAEIAADIAEALYHAHTRGVIHRDVKPGNVLLGADGHARLVDFGIARLLGDAMERQTETGTVMGTLRYMAPEQLAGQEVGPRVDLYGLGAVLHEMLTGYPPYPATSPVALLEQQAAGPPALPHTDRALAAVTTACLQHRPEDRPLHAGHVAAALRAWIDGDPRPALALGHAVPVPDPADAQTRPIPIPVQPPAVEPPAGQPQPRTLQRRGAVAAVILAVVVAIGAVGFTVFKPAQNTAAAPVPTAVATPLPAWATELADRYRDACGTSPTASEVAALSESAAEERVDAAVASCTNEGTGGGGKGKGKGKGGG